MNIGSLLPRHARYRPDHLAFVFGGEAIYALALPRADRLYLTRVHAEVEGDAFFPDFGLVAYSIDGDELWCRPLGPSGGGVTGSGVLVPSESLWVSVFSSMTRRSSAPAAPRAFSGSAVASAAA